MLKSLVSSVEMPWQEINDQASKIINEHLKQLTRTPECVYLFAVKADLR